MDRVLELAMAAGLLHLLPTGVLELLQHIADLRWHRIAFLAMDSPPAAIGRRIPLRQRGRHIIRTCGPSSLTGPSIVWAKGSRRWASFNACSCTIDCSTGVLIASCVLVIAR